MSEQRKKLRLGELLIQQGLITPDQLRIGMPMELVIVPFETESRGPVLTFAFRPQGAPNE